MIGMKRKKVEKVSTMMTIIFSPIILGFAQVIARSFIAMERSKNKTDVFSIDSSVGSSLSESRRVAFSQDRSLAANGTPRRKGGKRDHGRI